MNAVTKIDFSEIDGPVYTGRERGEQLRKKYGLDALDDAGAQVLVILPDATYSVSSSFFLGMFGPSVVRAGDKQVFYRQYEFAANDFLKGIIDGHIDRALQERNLFR